MITCSNCGERNPERARFCLRCGSPLTAAPTPDEERKIVTVLFCEAVGVAGRMGDPEDLKAALAPFHARLKRDVEGYGGTVDKFMGPVVMSVFGAPVQHEDDPHRAVLAALKIQRSIDQLNDEDPGLDVRVRMGANTGEVVVAFGAGPQIGERVTGDAVNTASRLQTSADVGEIVVGEPTYEATAHKINYEPLEAVTVKGKAEPLRRWRPVETRSHMGFDMRERTTTPFVGRGDERALLEGSYRRMITEQSVQLVTVTGEPGVGKSRLIDELSSYLDGVPELVRWRQGRCLPYGEGVSFWALGEIVKAEAGILEADPPDEAGAKLRAAVGSIAGDAADRDWLAARLEPLVGLAGTATTVARSELFTAWRTFLEALAADGPTILVMEDLQWADEPMLEFVDHLVDWTQGVPLLVVCAARPELYERHPEWGGGKRNSVTIALTPLSASETSQLISALLDRAVLPAETHQALLERSGGNPLYAEEFVRMLLDRGILERKGNGLALASGADIAVPAGVQGLIAARLDTLPPDAKSLLHDAAVLGKIFWSGALAAMGGVDESAVQAILHEVSRKELVRRARLSSMKGQVEYSFWHELVRVVAYGQIPRAARAARHRAAAAWLESSAGDRIDDLAELLAYHYAEALGRADGDVDDGLRASAVEAFLLAGGRVRRLDAAKAGDYYARALELAPTHHPSRGRALVAAGQVATVLSRFAEAADDFREAMAEFEAAGDRTGLGDAMVELARAIAEQTGPEGFLPLLEGAIELLEREPPGRELARAYGRYAGALRLVGDHRGSVTWAEKAIELARRLGMEDELVLALQYRGASRNALGDAEGIEDLREALDLALAAGLGEETALCYNNLAYELWYREGPRMAVGLWREMAEFCRSRGFETERMWALSGEQEVLFDLGDWETALELSREVRDWDERSGGTTVGVVARIFPAWIDLRRGDVHAAEALAAELVPRARESDYAEYLAPALMIKAEVDLANGDVEEAANAVREFAFVTADHPVFRTLFVPIAVRILVAADALEEAVALAEDDAEVTSPRGELSVETARAIVAEARGELADAAGRYRDLAERWRSYGFSLEEGQTLLGAGRCLIDVGRAAEAVEHLQRARAILAPLGVRPLLAEIDDLLGEETALTS